MYKTAKNHVSHEIRKAKHDLYIKALEQQIPYIVNICNACIDVAHFPKSWKKAKVVPLYISGYSNNVMNYKTIYVLPIISKLLELHVYNQLYAYLIYYKLMLDGQSSFRENRSFENILLKLTYFFLNNIDKGNLCDMVLVDPINTFVLVDHELILVKLYLYGCPENELAWFRSYLTERYQYVIYDSVLSYPLPVNIGVPSGSILGPLLYHIHEKFSSRNMIYTF